MAGSVAIERKTADAPALAIGGRFGKFHPEEEKASRRVEVKENEAIRQLKTAWKAFEPGHCMRNRYAIEEKDRVYRSILQTVANLHYTAQDVENFSLMLAEFQAEDKFLDKYGFFLSALINSGENSDYVIHTYHLDIPSGMTFVGLGFRNEKNITINGVAGNYLGCQMKSGSITVNGDAALKVGLEMKSGSITVKGNVKQWAGQKMKGGRITIEGDAYSDVGFEMKGGSITVNGDAGSDVGWDMEGGSITVNGDYKKIADTIISGKIYHKQNLIFERKVGTQIIEAWEAVECDESISESYGKALDIVKSISDYVPNDVNWFSTKLSGSSSTEDFSMKAGLFLSALINNGKHTDYSLHMSSFILLDYIGYRNIKNIIINSNVGNMLGHNMEGGSIAVHGNAGRDVGQEMKGGSISVDGDTGYSIGWAMENGSITVNGNASGGVGLFMLGGGIIINGDARYEVGYGMEGGMIKLEGNYKSLSDVRQDGQIFHKGELIFG
jgi:formylmethanofuran dehydrogenase subunit C